MKYDLAKKEPPVTANELLEEIVPLLRDYFEGDISLTIYGIAYSLPNGQKLLLKLYRQCKRL